MDIRGRLVTLGGSVILVTEFLPDLFPGSDPPVPLRSFPEIGIQT